jgi:hypothetical protein
MTSPLAQAERFVAKCQHLWPGCEVVKFKVSGAEPESAPALSGKSESSVENVKQ